MRVIQSWSGEIKWESLFLERGNTNKMLWLFFLSACKCVSGMLIYISLFLSIEVNFESITK